MRRHRLLFPPITTALALQEQGQILVTNPEKDPTMVEDILGYQKRLLTVLHDAFEAEPGFVYAHKVRADSNLSPPSPGQYLCLLVPLLACSDRHVIPAPCVAGCL